MTELTAIVIFVLIPLFTEEGTLLNTWAKLFLVTYFLYYFFKVPIFLRGYYDKRNREFT